MKNQTRLIAEKERQEYFIYRELDAPRNLVFKTFAQPELLVKWFLPKESNLMVNRMDCHTGGSFNFSHQGPNRMTFGFKGVYHEVLPDALIIKTSEFFGLPQKLDPVLEFTRFEQISDNKTRVSIHTICPSVDYRDNMISANMKPTLEATYSQLDELLNTLKNKKTSSI